MEGERKRKIKLFCPSVSKIIQIIASDEQKLDLGSIARVFGLDPNTLKLNGHFISRGVDFIASSVTWKSLIGFFSARGLSTGAADSDALLVDGKLSKIASKRSHCLEDDGNGIFYTKEIRECKKPQFELCRSSFLDVMNQTNGSRGSNSLGLKRKLSSEGESDLKRMKKADEAVSGLHEIKGNASVNSILSCCFT